MSKEINAYLLGGGIGSLAAAAFMIRDGDLCFGKNFYPRSKIHPGREFGWSTVYEFLGIDRQMPHILPHDKSLQVQFEALIKAFK